MVDKQKETGMTDMDKAEQVARLFHEHYERLAPEFGYATREASAKPWAEVPERNRRLLSDVEALAYARPGAGTTLTVPDSPKMLRETLCIAATAVGQRTTDLHRRDADVARLGRLIAECDRHRPLGPDGKHGNRHTATCGCEDVPEASRG